MADAYLSSPRPAVALQWNWIKVTSPLAPPHLTVNPEGLKSQEGVPEPALVQDEPSEETWPTMVPRGQVE